MALIPVIAVLVLLQRPAEGHLLSVIVESVRKGSITVIADVAPSQSDYSIYKKNESVAALHILSVVRITQSGKTRYRCEASIDGEVPLGAGESLTLSSEPKPAPPAYRDSFGRDAEHYLPQITSKDNRVMVLVPKGTAIVGTKRKGSDAYPEHYVELDTFYIDCYEVSNRDYLVFVKEARGNVPVSWENGEFPQKMAEYPVIVTYTEAEHYAKWAGKRLPTEFEWEKAANGLITPVRIITEMGIEHKPVKTLYPWGDDMNFAGTNSQEFWQKRTSYGTSTRGLLPVTEFSTQNRSAYGAVNMSGNAAEWTSSWYAPYEGNRTPNRRFGEQVKCIRGGSFAQPVSEQTTFSRAYGGLPSLSKDSAAGFRCVKIPDPADMDTQAREAMP